MQATHSPEGWPEFYKGRLCSVSYRSYVSRRYAPFIQEIVRSIKSGDRVVEVGCGLATITSILSSMPQGDGRPWCGFRCYDINPDMVEYARMNLRDVHPVEVGDARLPTGRLPDIVHSHGMLEHLSDEDIRAVVEAHRKDGARIAIHYVPGEKYETPSYGDERLMSLAEWHLIAAPTRSFTFNDDHDYVLIWEF